MSLRRANLTRTLASSSASARCACFAGRIPMLTLMTAQPAEAELPRLPPLQRIEEDRQGHRWLKESPDVGLLWQNYAYILDRPNNGQTDHDHQTDRPCPWSRGSARSLSGECRFDHKPHSVPRSSPNRGSHERGCMEDGTSCNDSAGSVPSIKDKGLGRKRGSR